MLLAFTGLFANNNDAQQPYNDEGDFYRFIFYGMKPDGTMTRRHYWNDTINTVTLEVKILSFKEEGSNWLYECEEKVYGTNDKLVETANKIYEIPRGADIVKYVNRYKRNPNIMEQISDGKTSTVNNDRLNDYHCPYVDDDDCCEPAPCCGSARHHGHGRCWR